MIRHILPRAEWGGWSGDAVTVEPAKPVDRQRDEVVGGILFIQWLGLAVEIAVGKVRRP